MTSQQHEQQTADEPQDVPNKDDGPEGEQTNESLTNGQPEPQDNEPDTFSRAYVEELRQEAAKHRTNSKKSDELSKRLVTSYVDATGRLHDSRDLTFSDDLMGDDGFPDPAKVNAAVEALIKDRPHLARIRPVGDVGQGVTGEQPAAGLAAFGSMLRDAAS